MTADNILVLIILITSVILFISEKLRVDLVAMLVLAALIFTGLLSPEEAFLGFASPAVVTVGAVFVISGAFLYSGLADLIARLMLRLAGRSELRLLVVMMATVSLMSAFINNVGAVAILLPAVVGIARKTNLAPSRLLMPLAFASLLGGNLTLIGTPPNILASSMMADYGDIEPFAFFDFTPLGLLVLLAGLIYMLLLGRRLLPDRSPGGDLSLAYPIREYLTEVRVEEGSPLVGRTLAETRFGEAYDLSVIQIHTPAEPLTFAAPSRRLQAGDILLIEGPPDDIVKVSQAKGLAVVPGWNVQDVDTELPSGTPELVEITLAPRSRFNHQTLKEIDFRAHYQLNVMAIRHEGRALVSHLGDVSLEFGDALLVQGPPDRINRLRQDGNFLVLDTPPVAVRRTNKAPLVAGILAGALVVATVGWLSAPAAILVGALLMILTGAIRMDEAYQSIDWPSIFLIAGMLPLGVAMEKTGTALLLANQLVAGLGGWGPLLVLLGIFLLTALLTEVISNAAATVLLVPIAIDVARSLGTNIEPFVMAVVLAASTSFLMPIGHQVNVLVFGPGGYKFTDYARVGIWLNLLILLLVALFLPLIWPLWG
jgi:di/tricarboxylate transporter